MCATRSAVVGHWQRRGETIENRQLKNCLARIRTRLRAITRERRGVRTLCPREVRTSLPISSDIQPCRLKSFLISEAEMESEPKPRGSGSMPQCRASKQSPSPKWKQTATFTSRFKMRLGISRASLWLKYRRSRSGASSAKLYLAGRKCSFRFAFGLAEN